MKPFVSIIIPVYNAEKTLKRCLDSVLSQSFRNFEAIVVNDGSQDCSGIICNQYGILDDRIRVIHQKNMGVSGARNTGILSASGEYLLFLDSDDALEPDALQQYWKASENGTYDVVIGSLAVMEENSYTRKIGVDRQISAGDEIWHQICTDPKIFGYAGGKMIRTDLIQNNKIEFNTQMRSQEDVDFFLSAYGFCARFRLIPQAVYRYFYVPATRNPPIWDFIRNQLKLLRIAQEKTNLTKEVRDCVHKRILSLLYTGLYHAVESDCFQETVEKIARLDGLAQLLRTVSDKGEHGFVARNFADGKYGRIQRYFKTRNKIRSIVWAIRRRKL